MLAVCPPHCGELRARRGRAVAARRPNPSTLPLGLRGLRGCGVARRWRGEPACCAVLCRDVPSCLAARSR